MANATNPAFRLLDGADDQAGARVRRIGGLTLWAETLAFRTSAAREFLDVTEQVATVVRRFRFQQNSEPVRAHRSAWWSRRTR